MCNLKHMQKEKKYLKCILNSDDADFSVGQDEVINSENVRFGSTDAGVINTIESIGSTTLLSQIQPSVNFVQIGAVADEANNRILYFLKDLYGPWDRIVCYDVLGNQFYDTLLANQVVGGLNFSSNSIIHSVRVVNGWLYWVDGVTNEPRKIDIDAAIKMNFPSYVSDAVAYVSPVDWREITLIKPPPPLAPNIQKDTDSGFANNFIANESFMFAFQYIYYNNEISVLGTYSPASKLNAVNDDYNRVIVQMDNREVIPQTVRIVNLIVRYSNTAFIIKTWDKNITEENSEIEDQNSGSQVLAFNFYNNITGQAVSSDYILKPFDSVPIYSKTLEVAKNRLFLGNNIEGYDAPGTTSLGYTLSTVDISGAAALNKNLIEVVLSNGHPFVFEYYKAYMVYLTEIAPVGYYSITSSEQSCNGCSPPAPPFPPPPTTVAVSGLTYRGPDQASVIASVEAQYGINVVLTSFVTTSNIVGITGITVSAFNVFKTKAQYKLGVVFYDYAIRKCGVVTPPVSSSSSDPTLVNIPAREFDLTSGTDAINWTLSNDDALLEIPEWAHYYSVVRTLNLRTRFFLQGFQQTSYAKYATKDANGNYVFTDNTFVTNAVGIGIDTTSLVQAGLGYVFTEGDVMYLIKDDNTSYSLSIIGQSGKYVIVNVPDGGIGDFTTFQMIYEIYTPYRSGDQEPYYEVGNLYRILNPRTSGRLYETISDIMGPDAYALGRNFNSVTYFAEAMSPNDRFYSRWETDAGKVNFIVKSGQSVKSNSISYSNTFIPGTGTNGLSVFEALSESSVPIENGEIQKLIVTSKVQDEGNIMLTVCTNQTSSLYLNETRVTDNTGATTFFAGTTDVIGTINSLKGSYGTINPESVTEFKGNVYWVDLLNGKFIQYSANGLYPISNYKMTRFWKLFSDQFMSMTQQEIEDLGNRPFIFTTVDPHHWELLISVPKLLSVPPKGTLPDYPFINYPFDVYDGQAKTLVFRINAEPNYWQGGGYKFCAEGFITIQNNLYSFKHGRLYQHNSLTSQCEFYGTQERAKVMCLSNSLPEVPKSYNNLTIQANMKPVFTYLYNDYPYQQSSDLIVDDYRSLEGIFYSPIYRNKLIPTSTGYNINGLLTGEKMRAEALKIMLEFDVSQKQLEFKFIDIGFSTSLGHTTNK
jgi:hypothetical protein